MTNWVVKISMERPKLSRLWAYSITHLLYSFIPSAITLSPWNQYGQIERKIFLLLCPFLKSFIIHSTIKNVFCKFILQCPFLYLLVEKYLEAFNHKIRKSLILLYQWMPFKKIKCLVNIWKHSNKKLWKNFW